MRDTINRFVTSPTNMEVLRPYGKTTVVLETELVKLHVWWEGNMHAHANGSFLPMN